MHFKVVDWRRRFGPGSLPVLRLHTCMQPYSGTNGNFLKVVRWPLQIAYKYLYAYYAVIPWEFMTAREPGDSKMGG